jgi:ATP-dependent Lon protease
MSTDTRAPLHDLPMLPLFRGVVFPHTTITLPVGREKSVALVQSLTAGDLVAIAVQRAADVQEPTLDELFPVATLARVQQLVRLTNGGWRVVLEGIERIQLTAISAREPFWRVEAERVVETGHDAPELDALHTILRENLQEVANQHGGALGQLLRDNTDPLILADRVASEIGLETEPRAAILAELDVAARLRVVIEHVSAMLTRADIKQKLEQQVRKEFGKNQREAILREQLRAIRKELGDDGDDQLGKLREQLDTIELPEDVRKVAEREYTRLEALNPAQAEYGVIRNYLEWIAELPWLKSADAAIDLDRIQASLDAGHDGLGEIKQRIMEHMAVTKLTGNPQGTILCLAGPPGVGKTSLAQSVAEALDRPLVRLSLGGVRDEAEVRGHRRTYVGALPGRIINAFRKAGVNNPVVVLDEIDKLQQGWMGSPEAALLEVLDPEQNSTFTDHYMELPFDLSHALFIATANDLQNISGPLRDRLEIIELSGYTPEEKMRIARDHLIPRQLKAVGLEPDALTLSDEALRAMILDYTREAGVRQLTRLITKVTRAVTLELARAKEGEDAAQAVHMELEDVSKYLGKARFFSEVAQRISEPGVATGLAWTPMGGDILFIETTRMSGKGRLEITGQLGDVMKESARAALAYVRSHADVLGVAPDFLDTWDLHLHVPAGAVPKDGPSAGVTIFTALTSLLTDRRVRVDTAMTGECTLSGRVLPVGGIKAKVLAAHRAGIKRIILPKQNGRDLDEIPSSVLDELEIILASDMREVLAAALEAEPGAAEAPAPVEPTEEVTHVTMA